MIVFMAGFAVLRALLILLLASFYDHASCVPFLFAVCCAAKHAQPATTTDSWFGHLFEVRIHRAESFNQWQMFALLLIRVDSVSNFSAQNTHSDHTTKCKLNSLLNSRFFIQSHRLGMVWEMDRIWLWIECVAFIGHMRITQINAHT